MIRKMKPARAKKDTVTARDAAEKRRLRNSRTSSIGCAVRRSCAMNAAVRTVASVNSASVSADAQPRLGASMIANTAVPTASAERTRPGTSSRGASGSREVGTTHRTSASAPSATGTFARNVACQVLASSSTPPAIGPSAIATPVTAPQMPIAFARSARPV